MPSKKTTRILRMFMGKKAQGQAPGPSEAEIAAEVKAAAQKKEAEKKAAEARASLEKEKEAAIAKQEEEAAKKAKEVEMAGMAAKAAGLATGGIGTVGAMAAQGAAQHEIEKKKQEETKKLQEEFADKEADAAPEPLDPSTSKDPSDDSKDSSSDSSDSSSSDAPNPSDSPNPTGAPQPPQPAAHIHINAPSAPAASGGGPHNSSGKEELTDKLAGGDDEEPFFGHWAMVWIGLALIMMLGFYWLGGRDALPAMIGPILFIVSIVIFEIRHKKVSRKNILARIFLLFLFAAVFAGGVYMTGARGGTYLYAMGSTGALSERFHESASDTDSTAKKAEQSIFRDFASNLQRNIRQASGEDIEGDVEEESAEAGLEILQPLMGREDQEVTVAEAGRMSVDARVKGLNPRGEMQVTVACNMQTEDEARDAERTYDRQSETGGYIRFAGNEQPIRPETFAGMRFEEAVSCRPSISHCGKYVTTITAQADEIRQSAKLTNFFISYDALHEALMSDAEFSRDPLATDAKEKAAIKRIFPQVSAHNPVSESTKGPIMVLLKTVEFPLVGLRDDKDFVLYAGFENLRDGWVMGLNSVTVNIPPDIFTPVPGFCDGWEYDGNVLTLTADARTDSNLLKVIRGTQKVFPSCRMSVNSGAVNRYTTPTQQRFFIDIDYDYAVQKQYDIEVNPNEGGECEEEAQSSSSSSSGSDDAEENTPDLAEQPSDEEVAKALDLLEEALDQVIAACEGKNIGDSCGTGSDRCTAVRVNEGENLGVICTPECIYYIDTSQRGLNQAYDCVPQNQCKSETTQPISCQSSVISGTDNFVCCQPQVRT